MSLSRHSRAMLLNVLWHHQGGSSPVGHPIRKILGIEPHARLTNEELSEAKWIDELLSGSVALAEQNEKLRKVLVEAKSMVGHPDNIAIINSALSLPNLTTPVLNRIKAEAYREAAEIVGPEDSYQDDWFKAKADSCAKLRAKADELEQSK